MKTSKKLLRAFESVAPYIREHRIAIKLFYEAIEEVKDLENQKDK